MEKHFIINLPVEKINNIVQSFEKVEVKKHEAIIKQGEIGEHFYIISSGSADC